MTDGLGGKLFLMEADGWAEVVGYYADGCIKVDVYEIDGWVGRGYYKILYYTDRWAEGVVWDVVLDGWAEGGIQYRWLYINQIRGGCLAECGIWGVKLVLPYEKPSSDHQNVSQPYSEEVINQSYRAPGAAGDLLTWLCEACVALRDSKFRPPKYGSTVPTSEFRDLGVDK
ncbi:hypothetical protein BDR06DRAFT_969240 [Suillus hirtellus]|nr:hypothetical protein BDR06DRAFT_969240 [Suillus hirtellus]